MKNGNEKELFTIQEKKYLLGVIDNRIILGEFEVTNRNGYNEFTASFEEGEAFDINTIDDDYRETYYEECWNCYDDAGKLDLLNDGDKTKQEVFDEWAAYEDYRNIKDCSCTDYEMEINGKTINFESICGGQHDCREDQDFEKMIFTNKEAFDLLMRLWDIFHLHEVTEKQKQEIKEVQELLQDYEEETTGFYDFIKKNLEA